MRVSSSFEEERRLRLRRLDDCLNLLEAAHEADLSTVNERMAHALSARVAAIHEGMLIADAIEEVLHEQEPFMATIEAEPINDRRMRPRRAETDAIALVGAAAARRIELPDLLERRLAAGRRRRRPIGQSRRSSDPESDSDAEG